MATTVHFQLIDVFFNKKSKPIELDLFGVDKHCGSVCCRVVNFLHYFYIAKTPKTENMTPLGILQSFAAKGQAIAAVEEHQFKTLPYFSQDNKQSVFKIFIKNPDQMNRVVNVALQMPIFEGASFYETNVDYPTRYMIDNKISGSCWLEINDKELMKLFTTTTCRREFLCDYTKCKPLDASTTPMWNTISAMKILSLDIECKGRPGIFPVADQDPIIQIGNVESIYGHKYFLKKKIFTLRMVDVATLDYGIEAVCFSNELQMIQAWAEYVNKTDPDIIIGYNINKFDFKYLYDRVVALKNKHALNKLSRLKNGVFSISRRMFSSNQIGNSEQSIIVMHGRLVLDVFDAVKRGYKLRSYKLNEVSKHFLKEQKNDITPVMINKLQEGSDSDRSAIANYCIQDCMLPVSLCSKLALIVNMIEMSRVTGITPQSVLVRGQQIRVFNLLLAMTKEKGFIIRHVKGNIKAVTEIPKHFAQQQNIEAGEKRVSVETLASMSEPVVSGKANAGSSSQGGEIKEKKERKPDASKIAKKKNKPVDNVFEGGCVLEPEIGLHDEPVVVLDFASLYPSLIIAYNLCYTTILENGPRDLIKYNLTMDDVYVSPVGYYFVRPHIFEGFLPIIERKLLAARANVKKQLAQATEESTQSVLNGRQLAVKLVANSLFGFTGATNGFLTCIGISSSVTSFGRHHIGETKSLVESKFSMACGYEHNSRVVYGDTDSVMIIFGGSLENAFLLGNEAVTYINDLFIKPIQIEFEKVYFPFLLVAKKHYVGLQYTSVAKFDKIDCKGIETVRRDNTPLIVRLLNFCINEIFINRNVDGALEEVKTAVGNLHRNQFNIDELVVSKEYSKLDYKVMQPHIAVVEKFKQRPGADVPQLGDRIPYVVLKGTGPIYKRAEDPQYAVKHGLSIDIDHYIKQITNPLKRLFDPIKMGAIEKIINSNGPRTANKRKQVHIDEMLTPIKKPK